MNKKYYKTLVFTIIIALLLSIFAGCSKDPADVSSGADDSAADQSEESSAEEGKIRVEIADQTFWVNAVNVSAGTEDEALLYDRDYRDENGPVLYVNGSAAGRTLISVKLAFKYGSPDYSVISSEVGAHEDVKMPIPVNGFVLSVSTSALPEGYKPNSVSNVTVSGWEYPEFELTDLTTVIPSARANTRRVNMTDPESGVFEEGKIYFCKKGYTVPQDSASVILNDPSAGYYKIDSVVPAGTAVEAGYSLLFTGAYNAAYAKEFFASGEVRFNDEKLLNGISDSPAVAFGKGEYIVIPRGNVNPESAKNGVYLYEISGNAAVTNAKGDFTNIVVRGGKIAYKTNGSENVVIPSSDGYVVTFAGESKTLCEGVGMGDSVKDLLITAQDLPAMFVRVKGLVFEIDSVNVRVNATHPCVLYTPEYGAATGSADCAEIAIEDGRIVSVTKAGNSAIPENGYVLSVKKGSQNYASVANRSSEGDPALVSLGGNMYSFTTFHYNATNATRQTDYIVIYNDSFGKSTATNVYGYEFAVDANGSITGSSYAGNMQIPRGGFVVSAHGANIQTLEKAYSYGAKVTLDKSRNNVTVQTTPESLFYDAEFRYNDLKAGYEDAIERLSCINISSIGPKVELIKSVYDTYIEHKSADSPEKSVERCRTIISMCEDLRFSLYESAPVENRAVWYRCNEKNDDEVRASCELMAQMGINAVYLETWYNGQFIGFSENPLIRHVSTHGDYDVLEGYCRIAHEYGIEVHCWVENFFIGGSGVLVDATKEYHLLDNKGKDYQTTMYGPFVFLDPLDPRSREIVLGIYREMITKYDIDGINLDYIRFPGAADDGGDFGYNDDIIEAFRAETGIQTDPRRLVKNTSDLVKWCRFREGIINDWVTVVYDLVQETKPNLSISCAVGSNYPSTRTDICQNFVDWVDKGLIDEVFSMSYFSNLESPSNAIKTFTRYTKGKCFYTIGLSAFESSPDYILVGQVDIAARNCNGSNLFSWGSLIKHEEHYFEALKESIWSRPAARCDSGSGAVYAYCQRFLEDSENVYKKLKPSESALLTELEEKCKTFSEDASAFDFKSADAASRAEYLQRAIGQMNELLEIAQKIADEQLKTKLTEQIGFIIDCLTVTR